MQNAKESCTPGIGDLHGVGGEPCFHFAAGLAQTAKTMVCIVFISEMQDSNRKVRIYLIIPWDFLFFFLNYQHHTS